jgi:hypothetical protein
MKYFVLVLGAALFVAAPLISNQAVAHHNWAAIYDIESDIEIEAVIHEIEFVNPHVRVSFIVDEGTANEKIYTTESNSVASLTRMGVTEDLLSVGTKVRVAGYRSRTRDDDIFMNHLLLPDHREIVFLRTAEARWPEESIRIGNTDVAHGRVVEEDFSKRPTSIIGVWSTIYGAAGSHRSENFPGEATEAALELQANAVEEEANCDPKGMPGAMGSPYPIELIDKGDTIVIHAEFYDSIRTVHMNADHKIPPADPGILGYSTGYWVGDTLVVSTSKGSDNLLQIHETFSLSGDHNRLNYTAVTIDPDMLVTPSITRRWRQYVPGAFVQPYNCTL